jgi:hypothetical protein
VDVSCNSHKIIKPYAPITLGFSGIEIYMRSGLGLSQL